MEQAEPHLKVTDRRHFTADGELKAETTAEGGTPAASEPQVPEPPGPGSLKAGSTPTARPSIAEPPPVTFAAFIISLATQAADLIGGEEKDLGGARQVISAIEMLREKTEGRRTDEETRIIDAVLFDLRLAFVGANRGTGV